MNTVNLPFHCSLLSAQFFSLPDILYIDEQIHTPIYFNCEWNTFVIVSS